MVTITESRTLGSTLARGSAFSTTFSTVPVLDFSLSQSADTKPRFLQQLREALVIVGFFYLKNPPVSKETQTSFVKKSIQLCDLPLEKKIEIDMINSKHFLGYSRMGLERTARKIDQREMFDFLSPVPAPTPDDPIYMNVQGPNQWPDETVVPGFRSAIESYLAAVGDLGHIMNALVAEALDLEPTAFDKFFGHPPRNKVSLLKYPVPDSPPSFANGHGRALNGTETASSEFQGVGSHKDGGFLTYLLQATPHAGLEVQNKSGQWIPVPPIQDTLVINVGRSLESITKGVCLATTHRVNLKPEYFYTRDGTPLGPRYSYPVFQTLKMDLKHDEYTSLKLPKHITDLSQNMKVNSDAEAFFEEYHLQSPGKGIFTARLTSHPEVGWKWYPELMEGVLKGQEEFRK